jgi:hypothetical protein
VTKTFSLVSAISGGNPVVGRPAGKIGTINWIALVVTMLRNPIHQNDVQLGPG